jgi:hypothetical protein
MVSSIGIPFLSNDDAPLNQLPSRAFIVLLKAQASFSQNDPLRRRALACLPMCVGQVGTDMLGFRDPPG